MLHVAISLIRYDMALCSLLVDWRIICLLKIGFVAYWEPVGKLIHWEILFGAKKAETDCLKVEKWMKFEFFNYKWVAFKEDIVNLN